MNKKTNFDIKYFTIALLLFGILILGTYSHILQDECRVTDKKCRVTDRVTVDKEIIEGYEGCDYIPRSSGINKNLREVKK